LHAIARNRRTVTCDSKKQENSCMQETGEQSHAIARNRKIVACDSKKQENSHMR